MGTTLIALITDYVFQNDLSVGLSVSIVGGIATLFAGILIRNGLSLFVELMEKSSENRDHRQL